MLERTQAPVRRRCAIQRAESSAGSRQENCSQVRRVHRRHVVPGPRKAPGQIGIRRIVGVWLGDGRPPFLDPALCLHGGPQRHRIIIDMTYPRCRKNEEIAKLQARRFYSPGGPNRLCDDVRCLVTGEPNFDWDHVLENPGMPWDWRSIVPLSSTLNRLKHSFDCREPNDNRLTPRALRDESSSFFRKGYLPQAFGCAWLGASIALHHHGTSEDAITLTANALCSLRPMAHVAPATLVLSEIAEPVLTTRRALSLSKRSVVTLAMEIGSYFRDHGMLDEAQQWTNVAWQLLAAKRSWDVADQVIARRLYEHSAIICIGSARYRTGREFNRRASDVPVAPPARILVANEGLWDACSYLFEDGIDRTDAALDVIEQGCGPIDPEKVVASSARTAAISAWTRGELLCVLSWREMRCGHIEAAYAMAEKACDWFRVHKIAPTEVGRDGGVEHARRRYPDARAFRTRNRHASDLVEFRRVAVRLLRRIQALPRNHSAHDAAQESV